MMLGYIGRRAYHSVISVIGLLTLVFFLTRLTGDPSALYLPLDSSLEARQAFARLNGLDQPIYVHSSSTCITFCHWISASPCGRTGRRSRWLSRPFRPR